MAKFGILFAAVEGCDFGALQTLLISAIEYSYDDEWRDHKMELKRPDAYLPGP